MKSRVLLTLLTGLILALGVSGCLEIPTPNALGVTQAAPVTPSATVTAEPTATPRPTARVVGYVVQVRDAEGIVRDWLKLGDVVTVLGCKDNMCKVSTNVLTGYVFRGCLSGNADLGCKEK